MENDLRAIDGGKVSENLLALRSPARQRKTQKRRTPTEFKISGFAFKF